ncbi:malate dehydrogenase [Pseudonocardia endophytica]|uniref:Malate dehydrogenase n=1 Tax=Pseudonocardia endophytica TaxID=401976 RepID=A0A4R1HK55_PSEEN|nr:malate dehydrogenase [Pseudonocardia endophytica]TCK20670.1 malate dehydrogenase [Pseudonocardia endophytica]
MSVRGASDVEAAADGSRVLRVGPGDVVTPLARERAQDLGVTIEVGGGAGNAPPPAVPPSRQVAGSGTTQRSGPRPGSGTAQRPGPVPQTGSGPAAGPAAPGARTGRSSNGAARAERSSSGAAGHGAGRPTSPAARAERSSNGAAGVPGAVGIPGGAPPPPVRPPSGALFRRGAPLPPGLASAPARPARHGRTGRVVVVGAGHVGMITAMRLAEADVFDEVVLVDIDEGRAKGIALDLTHTAPLAGFATRIRGSGTVEGAGSCDYAVITAGRPRTPGMSRSDLIGTNAAIVGDVASTLAATSPHVVLVVITNPLDEMTQHAWQASGLPSHRVLGMAGVLDTARFQALASLTGAGRADRIDALALGSHGEEMVVPLSRVGVGGRPIEGDLDAVVDRTRGSGAEVVGLLSSGSAFMAPGMSAARMVLAMAADSGEVMPAAVLADGQYGIRDVYVGLPARLGRDGVREIVELPLAADELTALRTAADRIRERLADLAPAR